MGLCFGYIGANYSPFSGGLIVTVRGDTNPSRGLVQLYYMAFLVGFFFSATIFYVLNLLFPYKNMGEFDDVDVYGTFTASEAKKRGVLQLSTPEVLEGTQWDEEGKNFASEVVVEKK